MLLPSNTPVLTTHTLEVTAKPAPTATPLGPAPGSASGSNPVPPTRNNPRIETLKELLLLEAQRERMESQLFLVLERICALQRQAWGHLRTSPSLPIPRRKRMAPGELRKQVFEVLRSAGPQGLRVSQIAATLGVRSANLHAFFYSLRGRHPEVQKIASGHYRLCMGLLASSLDGGGGGGGGGGG
ncbi:MAG: hypothetical protein RLZZ142_125, partial [Verrucomicrobiota bacterium]